VLSNSAGALRGVRDDVKEETIETASAAAMPVAGADAGADPEVVERIATRILALPPASVRLRVGIAGPPGAGKSTLAEALVARLNGESDFAALVPMDGFHLDNAVLDARGLRHRKGAPETFDAVGFIHTVRRLAAEPEVAVPVFDRTRDLSVAAARVIGPETRVVIIEGNYLLMKESPWYSLHGLWDLGVYLDVPEDDLEDRLIRRWLTHGLDYADARQRARMNDLPNARRVMARRAQAHMTV
jgi:pantothenate kinase